MSEQAIREYLTHYEHFSMENPALKLSDYHEGLIAKKLLRANLSPDDIVEAISTQSPIANQPGKFAYGYASGILQKSINSIEAEDNIKNIDRSIDMAGSLEVIEYRQLAKNQLDKEEKINAAFDTKIAAKMLQLGFHEKEVRDAIMEASPIAREAGRNQENYASYITKKAVERKERYVEKLKSIEATYDQTIEEYLARAENVRAAYPDQTYGNFQDGRIAIEMLRQGYFKDNIERAIAEISPVAAKLAHEKELPPERYAKSIVYRATQNIKKMEDIENLPQPQNDISQVDYLSSVQPQSAIQAYQYTMKYFMTQNPDANLNTFVDTQITKSLLSQYTKAEVEAAIISASPIAVLPGRNTERYVASVIHQASEQLDRQYARIHKNEQTLKTEPAANQQVVVNDKEIRLNQIKEFNQPVTQRKNAAHEYLRQAQQLDKKGITSVDADSRITKSMLKKGYSQETIAKTLSKYSPEYTGTLDNKPAKAYVKSIANSPSMKKVLAEAYTR